MSSVVRPTGRRSSRVYWRRRVVLLLVLALIAAAVWWWLRPSSPSPAAAPPPSTGTPSGTASPPTTPSPSASTPVSPSPGGASTPAGSATPPASPAGGTACTPAEISVDVGTDSATYAAGSTVRVTLVVRNTSDRTCVRDVGSRANELWITQDSKQIWSSDDCVPAGTTDAVTMAPGRSYSTSLTWNGRTTPVQCGRAGAVAGKGAYQLLGRNGEIVATAVPFDLT